MKPGVVYRAPILKTAGELPLWLFPWAKNVCLADHAAWAGVKKLLSFMSKVNDKIKSKVRVPIFFLKCWSNHSQMRRGNPSVTSEGGFCEPMH